MDEHGEVGTVSVAESSAVTVTVSGSDETLVESMGGEGEDEGTYNEGNGGEIIVEVVGSDVFVDGVSGDGDGLRKEGLAGRKMESFGNDEVVKDDTGSREGGQQEFVAEEGAVLVQEEDWSSKDEIPDVEDRPVVETVSEASIDDGANHSSSEFSNHLTEAALKGNVGVLTPEEASHSHIGVTEATFLDKKLHSSGEDQGMKDNPVGETNANHEILDTDSPLSFKPPNDSAGCDVAVVDAEVSSTLNNKVLKSVPVDSSGRDGGQDAACTGLGSSNHAHISPDQCAVENANNSSSLSGNRLPSSGEVLASESFTSGSTDDLDAGEHKAKAKPVSDLVLGTESEYASGEIQVVEQEEDLATTGRDSGAEPEASGGPAGDLDVGEHEVKVRPMSHVVLDTEPDYVIGETQDIKQEEDPVGTVGDLGVEPEAYDDNNNEKRNYSEDLPSMKQEATNGSDGDVHAIPESSHKPSSVIERGEWIAMDIDEVLDFKDEATALDAPVGNLSSSSVNTGNFFGRSMRITEQVDIAECHISDVGTNAKDSHICEEPVQLDFRLSKEHQQVAAGDAEVIAFNQGADFREEVLDGDASFLENEKLDIGGGTEKEVAMEANRVLSSEQIGSVTPMGFLVEPPRVGKVPACDAVDGRSSCLAEENNLKDEKVGVFFGEDAFLGNEPPEGAEAGLFDTPVQGMDSNVEASSSIQDKKQDEVGQLNEAPMPQVDWNQTKDKSFGDKVSNEGAGSSPISEVQASAGSQSTVDFTGFHGGVNVPSPLSDGNQNLNVIGVSEEKSVLTRDQTIATTEEALNQATEKEDECCKTDDNNFLQAVMPEAMSVEGQQVVGVGEQYDYEGLVDNRDQDMVIEEHSSETDQSMLLEKETSKPFSSLMMLQSGYLLPPENEGEFSTSDLVWGKVRSHPWWPGQILDPADASDKAVRYYKKDCFLVAYFGDRTFAWNDASVLKPFRSHFSQIEKQISSEAFQTAVSSALDEVSRRVELGLFCSCIPRNAYERIECQIVENTGIREESSRRYGVDKSSGATSFEPDKLLQQIRLLAQSPLSMADRLELAIANAQLSAFSRFKGYRPPPTFNSKEASLENDAGTSELIDEPDHLLSVTVDGEQVPSNTSSHKRKLNLKDSLQPKKKERSLSELMGDMAYSPDEEDDEDGKALSKSVSTYSGKKRKAVDPVTDGSDRRISIYAAKVSTTSSSPKPSFKVGECIRRIASQLTGSASILKGNDQQGSDASTHISENSQRGSMLFPTDISLEEMLSQLQLAARDPKKGYSFLNNIILFFSVFRNSVVTKHASGRSGGGRKRKTSYAAGVSTEEFEFDDVNDSYWTDRIVHNYSEEQLLQNGENGDEEYSLIVSEPDKFQKPSRRSYSRKQYSNGNYETSAEETTEDIERKKLLPAELMLTFAEGDSLPSEMNLNKMFRRFGPLKESETEVDQASHRARVVFKRGSDAEVAHSSAGTFNIFGSKLVSYQLSYSPSNTFRALPLLISQGQEDAS